MPFLPVPAIAATDEIATKAADPGQPLVAVTARILVSAHSQRRDADPSRTTRRAVQQPRDLTRSLDAHRYADMARWSRGRERDSVLAFGSGLAGDALKEVRILQ